MKIVKRRGRKDIFSSHIISSISRVPKLHRSGNHHPIVARARRLEGGQLSPVRKGSVEGPVTGTISANCMSDTVFTLV